MANYLTPENFRRITGINTDDLSDDDLTKFIPEAQKDVLRDISVHVKWEQMDGDIDGSNKTFYITKIPIADTDGDKTVTKDDVEVSTWEDVDDETTRTVVEVDSIDASVGKIVLKVAPGSEIEAVTCNYHYFKSDPDWTLIERALAYYVAYLFALRELAFIPDSESKGGLRITIRDYPWIRYQNEYWKLVDEIVQKRYGVGMPRKFRSLDEMLAIKSKGDQI